MLCERFWAWKTQSCTLLPRVGSTVVVIRDTEAIMMVAIRATIDSSMVPIVTVLGLSEGWVSRHTSQC